MENVEGTRHTPGQRDRLRLQAVLFTPASTLVLPNLLWPSHLKSAGTGTSETQLLLILSQLHGWQ